MVCDFGHQFFFHRHNTVLVSPWLFCIDKWHAEILYGCPGLNMFKWVVAGGIFLKDEVEQQQHVYFKSKVFTITDTGRRPPQCIDIAPKKMMVWQKELIAHALQGMKCMHVFLYSLSCLCSANSWPNGGIVSVVPIDDQMAIKASDWVIFQRSSSELLTLIKSNQI
jgi:hypothetical protein